MPRPHATLRPVIVVAAVVLYAETLRYSFKNLIAPLYASTGLIYQPPHTEGYLGAIALTAAVALLLPPRITRPSDMVLWVIFTVSAAPSILVAHYLSILNPPNLTQMGLSVAGAMLTARYLVRAGPRDFDIREGIKPLAFWQIITVVSALIYADLILTNGFSLRYLNLYDVYSVRADFETAISGNILLAYLLPVVYYVINPILMMRGLAFHKWGSFLVGLGGELYIYSVNGSKTLLFSFVAVGGLWLLFRRHDRPSGHRIFVTAGLAALVITAFDTLRHHNALTTLFVRRELAVPGALTTAYVSIFGPLPKEHFAHFIPGLTSPYPLGPSYMVGALFVHNGNTNANVGMFGHGFLQAGYAGMFIEAVYVALLLWLLDSASRGLPLLISCAATIMPALAFTEASAFTVTLTHGFLAAVILLAIAPRSGWGKREPGPRATYRGRLSRPDESQSNSSTMR